jgi:hypothetical protein
VHCVRPPPDPADPRPTYQVPAGCALTGSVGRGGLRTLRRTIRAYFLSLSRYGNFARAAQLHQGVLLPQKRCRERSRRNMSPSCLLAPYDRFTGGFSRILDVCSRSIRSFVPSNRNDAFDF